MEQIGFGSVKLSEDLDRNPYDSNAQRLIITGVKTSNHIL